MGDEIRINWNFESDKEIDVNKLKGNTTDWDSLNWYSNNTFNKHKIGDKCLNLRDGVNASEAEYIVSKLEEGGYLDDGELDDDEIETYLKNTYGWSRKGVTGKVNETVSTDAAVSGFRTVYNEIKATYGTEVSAEPDTQSDAPDSSGTQPEVKDTGSTTAPKLDTSKAGLSDTPNENGNYSVTVQSWGSAPIEGNDFANDCLGRIIRNYYPNLEWGSDEHTAIMEQIMNLNPNIYGTDENDKRRGSLDGQRMNTYIYDGETILLPANDSKAPEDSGKEGGEQGTTRGANGVPEFLDEYELFDEAEKRIRSLSDSQLESLKNGEKVEFEVKGNNTTLKCAWQLDENGVLNGYGTDKNGNEKLVWQFKQDGSQITHEYMGDTHIEKEFNEKTGTGAWRTYKGDSDTPTNVTNFVKEGDKWVKAEVSGAGDKARAEDNADALSKTVTQLTDVLNPASNYTEEYQYQQVAEALKGKSAEEVAAFLAEFQKQNANKNDYLQKIIFDSLFTKSTYSPNRGTTKTGYTFNTDNDANKKAIREAILKTQGTNSFNKVASYISANNVDIIQGNKATSMSVGDAIKLNNYVKMFDDSHFADFANKYKKFDVDELKKGKISVSEMDDLYKVYEQKEAMFNEFEDLYSVLSGSDVFAGFLSKRDRENYPGTNGVSLESDNKWLKTNGRNVSTDKALGVYTAHIQQMFDYIELYGTEADKQKAAEIKEKYS